MTLTSSSPLVIAHRGASAHAPENTLSAFKLAIEQGASAIELDVQLTSDQEVVVFHDLTTDRITNTAGKIKKSKLEDLKKLNAGYAYGPAFQGERIPTLAEVFTKLPDIPLINIELKNLSTPFDDLPQKVLGLIHQHKKSEQVLISSFNTVALKTTHSLDPNIPLGRLLHSPLALIFKGLILSRFNIYSTVHLSSDAVNRDKINFLHSRGKSVYVYTLNHPAEVVVFY